MKNLYIQSLLILLCLSSAYQITSSDNNIKAPRSNSFYTLKEIDEGQASIIKYIAQLKRMEKTSWLWYTAKEHQLQAQIPLLERMEKKYSDFRLLLLNGQENSNESIALNREVLMLQTAINSLNIRGSGLVLFDDLKAQDHFFKRPKQTK